MDYLTFYFIAGAYILQLIELVFLPIPSEISIFQSKISRMDNMDSIIYTKNYRRPPVMLIIFFIISIIYFVISPFLHIFKIYFLTFPILIPDSWFEVTHIIGTTLILFGSLTNFITVIFLRNYLMSFSSKHKMSVYNKNFFRISRHPITISMYVIMLGILIIFPTILMVLSYIIILIYIHIQIKNEENYLIQKFGREYLLYKNQVPRYLF